MHDKYDVEIVCVLIDWYSLHSYMVALLTQKSLSNMYIRVFYRQVTFILVILDLYISYFIIWSHVRYESIQVCITLPNVQPSILTDRVQLTQQLRKYIIYNYNYNIAIC